MLSYNIYNSANLAAEEKLYYKKKPVTKLIWPNTRLTKIRPLWGKNHKETDKKRYIICKKFLFWTFFSTEN